MSESPRVLSFDRPPTDEELCVYQPRRTDLGPPTIWKQGPDGITIGTQRSMKLGLSVGLGLLVGAMGLAAVLFLGNVPSPVDPIEPVAAVMGVALLIIAMTLVVDVRIRRRGPLVDYRSRDRTVLIEGRGEPLDASRVIEIVKLSQAHRVFTVGSRGGSEALYLIVFREAGQYHVERLFHGYASHETTNDLGGSLAGSLGVSYRRILLAERDPVLSVFPNTRPPKGLFPSEPRP